MLSVNMAIAISRLQQPDDLPLATNTRIDSPRLMTGYKVNEQPDRT